MPHRDQDGNVYSLHEPPSTGRWHLKRDVQIGHIITTCTVLFSVIWYAGQLDKRIAMIEQTVSSQRERDERQDKLAAEALSMLRQQLDRLEVKLDRVIEGKR